MNRETNTIGSKCQNASIAHVVVDIKAEIEKIRLNEAVRMISNSGLSIQSVAEKCGFCCASHLNTRFKAVFGHNPSVFRYQDPK